MPARCAAVPGSTASLGCGFWAHVFQGTSPEKAGLSKRAGWPFLYLAFLLVCVFLLLCCSQAGTLGALSAFCHDPSNLSKMVWAGGAQALVAVLAGGEPSLPCWESEVVI